VESDGLDRAEIERRLSAAELSVASGGAAD